MKKVSDLTGQRFGRLLVLNEHESRRDKANHASTWWKCRCDCGNEKFIRARSLIIGSATSCGCYQRELARKRRLESKTHNTYDLTSKSYGIGYCSDGTEFYFDLEDYDKIKDYRWSHNKKTGYIYTVQGNTSINFHSLISPKSENLLIAHIHREARNDNRKVNLRFGDISQVTWNTPVQTNNKSGVTGVYYSKSINKWIADITHYGNRIHKSFNTKEEAFAQRKAWEEEFYSEYSYDNSQAKKVRLNIQYSEETVMRREAKDLIGQRFGKLIVAHKAPNIISNNDTYRAWYCECDCGNMCIVSDNLLINDKTQSCGCTKSITQETINNIKSTSTSSKNNTSSKVVISNKDVLISKVKNLSGQRFGRLTVLPHYEIRLVGKKVKTRVPYWLCRCDCGNEKLVNSRNLIAGGTISCGCYKSSKRRPRSVTWSRQRILNKYDLTSKPYGIGYCSNDNSEFYFDLEDYDKIKNYTWCNDRGYIRTSDDNNNSICITSLIIPEHSDTVVAYIHGKSSAYDNRKSNLRLVDRTQLVWNKPISANNTSGVTGVSYCKATNNWTAYLTYYGKTMRKYFENKQDAIKQRKAWEEEYFGEYSYSNSQAIKLT